MNISTAWRLLPDSSKNHPQINFYFLVARHYIWICKNKKASPKVEDFLKCLKSIFIFLKTKQGAAPQKSGNF